MYILISIYGMYVEVEIFYCLKLAFDSSDLNFVLGKRHISILSTRNVIWTLGGGGGGWRL